MLALVSCRRRLAAFLGTAIALHSVTISSCANSRAAGPVSIAPAPAGTPWDDTLAQHTRRAEPYDWALRQADLRATLVTPRLRKAFLDAREQFQGRFSEETARDLVALGNPDEGTDHAMKPGPDSEEQVIVFAAMYVTDQKNRDIAASYTIWETRLTRGGASVKPIAIESVRNTPAAAAIFPYVDRFDDLYLIRFPLVDGQGHAFLSPGGEPLRLEVKSALADAVVEWTLVE